jgi:nitroreductase
MLAEFEPAISYYGAHFYRNLFWETGMVGQVLYLEAEAFGNRSTGIGCFFDDPMHEAFGLRSRDYQSLYHFTIGGPVQDARLTTLPAYFHLRQK